LLVRRQIASDRGRAIGTLDLADPDRTAQLFAAKYMPLIQFAVVGRGDHMLQVGLGRLERVQRGNRWQERMKMGLVFPDQRRQRTRVMGRNGNDFDVRRNAQCFGVQNSSRKKTVFLSVVDRR
jgi:hypothetical protein